MIKRVDWSHYRHARTGDELTLGERAADLSVRLMGSWTFIMVQTIVVAVWVLLNVLAISLQWDVYPFILLNLAFSTSAAYSAPLILLAGRRQNVRADEMQREALEILRGLKSNHG